MFLRIYSGIALAIVAALAVVYTTYKLSYSSRYAEYSESILKGSLVMIAEGYQRQNEENRERWVELISKITGFQLSFHNVSSNGTDFKIETATESQTGVYQLSHNNIQVRLQLEGIDEQQYRTIALLALNELAVSSNPDKKKVLKQLDSLYPFAIRLINDKQVKLDNQQKLRLNAGNVVASVNNQQKQTKVYVKAPGGDILMVGPIPLFEPLTNQLLILLILFSVLITSFVTYLLIKRLEWRLNVVNDILSEFGPKHLKSRVPIHGNDVITRLGIKVNEMADRIEELLAHQKEITQAVSHELRTPLARIKFRVQILNDMSEVSGEAISQQELENRTAAISKDILQLENLIDELLTLHKLDKERNEYQRLVIDIAPILDNIIESNSIRFDNIQFDNQISNPINILGNAHDLNRLLENLITNACKHAKSKVALTCEQSLLTYTLSIEDDGHGIPEQQRERIFQPFTRLENLQNKKNTGYGLGLAIVQSIAKLNDVEVKIDDSPLGGAKFQLFIDSQTPNKVEAVT